MSTSSSPIRNSSSTILQLGQKASPIIQSPIRNGSSTIQLNNRKRELSLSPIPTMATTPPQQSAKRAKIYSLFHTPTSDDQIFDLEVAVNDFWLQRRQQADEEEEEEEEEEDEDIPTDSISAVLDKPLRRSLYSELLLSSNLGTEEADQEALLHSRRKSATITSRLFDEDEDENEGVTGDIEDTEDDKTTIPLSRPYAPPVKTHYDDEIDALFSSHADADVPPEFVLSSSIKMAILNQQHDHTPRYHTECAHYLTKDYFSQCGPQDRFIDIPSSPSTTATTTATATLFRSRFSELKKLGSGEFAEVHKVLDLDTNTISAIKMSKAAFMGWDDRWQQLIEVEHLMLVQNSKYCVELINAWEEKGHLYIQLGLCPSGSLDEYMPYRNRKVSEDIVWKIFYEIILGINDIHKADIVHLDLKPSNILIDDRGNIKIGDFGISVRAPVDMRWVRGEGDRRYMAPDLLREEFDKPADIFSLGLILLELATGIVLPGTGESWEMLRVGDFSKQKNALSKLSLEMTEMIEWLLTTSSEKRPTVQDIMHHPTFIKVGNKMKEDAGALAYYINELRAEEAEVVVEEDPSTSQNGNGHNSLFKD